jgi:hypothetical protein
MNKRFIKLYEAISNRYNRGGFLVSDIVKFVDNVLTDKFFKSTDDAYKDKVKEYIECGDTLRVKNVKSTFPAVMGAGNSDYNGYSFSIEVTREIAPGKYSNDSIVVPQHLLVRIEDTINLPKVPDKFKAKDKSIIKPVPVSDENEETPFFSPGRTHTTDKGNKKDTPSETKLLNTNIKIPSSPAKGFANPASYTAKYLP